jgi:very-short-patch-repair endonuclease
MAGLTDRMIRARLASGRLASPAANVLRVPGAPTTWRQRLLAACLAGGASSTASHRAAAALHGFDGFPPGILEITVDRAQYYRPEGIVMHTTTDFAVVDRCLVDAIPTTTPLRTLLDLGAVVHQDRLVDALDSAERDGLVDREDLRSTLAIVRRQGRNGIGPLAALLEDRRGNQPRSVLERKMLRLLERYRLPRPLCQYRVLRPDGRLADLDFAYPKDRIGIEVDGHLGHATRRQRRNDYRRSNQVVLDDWRMLRFDYTDVTRRADYVAETVRAALEASRDLT